MFGFLCAVENYCRRFTGAAIRSAQDKADALERSLSELRDNSENRGALLEEAAEKTQELETDRDRTAQVAQVREAGASPGEGLLCTSWSSGVRFYANGSPKLRGERGPFMGVRVRLEVFVGSKNKIKVKNNNGLYKTVGSEREKGSSPKLHRYVNICTITILYNKSILEDSFLLKASIFSCILHHIYLVFGLFLFFRLNGSLKISA